jgi:predicted membrane channel-forming protein YqfA (hemolysin III family)
LREIHIGIFKASTYSIFSISLLYHTIKALRGEAALLSLSYGVGCGGLLAARCSGGEG